MARPPKRAPAGRSLARLFADDPLAAVLTVLREAGPDAQLRAEQIKRALLERGVPSDRLDVWRRVQPVLITHERVDVGGDRYRRTYRHLPEAPQPSPAQALALLADHRLPAPRRAALVEVVRAALERRGGGTADPARLARLEQREKDVVRVLAEMAIEVEELATNEASSRAVVHTVRALTKLAELQPIERSGTTTRFDRTRHTSVGGRIADGAPVIVLRPGYVWNRPDGELPPDSAPQASPESGELASRTYKQILIARAVVQDRSHDT